MMQRQWHVPSSSPYLEARHLRREGTVIPDRIDLIVFKGLMGTGKSTLSRALGQRLGYLVVDKDDFSDVLLPHLERYGPLAYEAMFLASRSLLQQGFSVICDSPLRGQIGYRNAARLAQEVGAQLHVIVCVCSDEALWRERLETRTRRPAHLVKTWQDLERYQEVARADFEYEVDAPMLEVDTVNSLSDVVEEITFWLNNRYTKKGMP